MRERGRKQWSVFALAALVLAFLSLAFASTGSDGASVAGIPALHVNSESVQKNRIVILAVSTTTGATSTTTTAVTTTTSTSTTTTTTTSTTLTTTRSTSTTTTTMCYTTTTTSTTSTTYVSTSFYSTVTTPTTMGVTSTEKTTTTTTTTSTRTDTSQPFVTTLITTTMTITATPARRCIIASVAYGSPFAPEVQLLREFRDGTVMQSFSGGQFMKIFERFYYSFSTEVAGVAAETPFLQALVRAIIYPLIASLRVSASIFMPKMPEFTIVILGLIESALVGIVYASPLIILSKTHGAMHELKRRPERET